MSRAVILILIALVGLNLIVSFRIARSPLYERQQKQGQLVLIWLLPALGAIIVWSIYRQTHTSPTTETPRMDKNNSSKREDIDFD